MPQSMAQSPIAITTLGPGVASHVFRRGFAMLWVTTPVTSNPSAWRGEATSLTPIRSASWTGPKQEPISISHPLHDPASTCLSWMDPFRAPTAGAGGGSPEGVNPTEACRRGVVQRVRDRDRFLFRSGPRRGADGGEARRLPSPRRRIAGDGRRHPQHGESPPENVGGDTWPQGGDCDRRLRHRLWHVRGWLWRGWIGRGCAPGGCGGTRMPSRSAGNPGGTSRPLRVTFGEIAVAVMAFAALAGLVGGLLAPAAARRWIVGGFTALSAAAAGAAAVWVLLGNGPIIFGAPNILPLAGVAFDLDGLGSIFVLATAIVGVPASVYGIGYSVHGLERRSIQMTFPLFVVSLLLVPMASTVSTLLVLWEAMALTSLVLVGAEHEHRSEVRDATWWYGTMSHLSMVAVLLGLVVFAGHAGGESFAALRDAAAGMPEPVRAGIFAAAVVGFGAKAGIVPLHVWLPRAHPEAPSHISALMSGAMVN